MKLTSLLSVIAIGTSVLQHATPANANLLNRLFNKKKTLRHGNNHDDAAAAIEEQHRLLQDLDGSLSMPTDNTSGMDVVDTVVAKLKEQGETLDPVMLAQLPAVEALELEESPTHYYDEHDFTDKCLKLLFIILPDYKASKLSFICGESVVSTSSSTAASTTTTTTTTQPVSYTRSALREGEEAVSKDVPLERRLEIIKYMEPHGAKADSTFSFMYNLISKKSCDALVKYMDSSLECDIDAGVDIPAGISSHGAEEMYDSWTPFEGGERLLYNKKLFAKDIVEIIGADETMKLIDYFHESLGEDLTIDCMYLARHGDPGDQLFNTPWHKDNYATMEITLNDDYDGGEVLHLNATGVHVTDARPGSVTGKTLSLSLVCILSY